MAKEAQYHLDSVSHGVLIKMCIMLWEIHIWSSYNTTFYFQGSYGPGSLKSNRKFYHLFSLILMLILHNGFNFFLAWICCGHHYQFFSQVCKGVKLNFPTSYWKPSKTSHLAGCESLIHFSLVKIAWIMDDFSKYFEIRLWMVFLKQTKTVFLSIWTLDGT